MSPPAPAQTGIRYQIGEVLRHKIFGFRAVVIGWDLRPEVDVSDWDGVVRSKNGADQPFYRMLPDMADCIEFLGGPRDVRYVAEENLEPLLVGHRRVSHPGLTRAIFSGFEPGCGRFLPSESLAFQYPGSQLEEARRTPRSHEVGAALRPRLSSLHPHRTL